MLRKTFFAAALVSALVVLTLSPAMAAKPSKNQAPTVTTFDVPATSALPVPILTLTAADSDGSITGYMITESSTPPSAVDPNWSVTAPVDYTTASVGSVTLYAWARDDKDAVSAPLSDTVDIPMPPIDADTLDGLDSTDFALVNHSHGGNSYANVIVVAKSGGDFSDPIAAMNSIADASSANPYLVKIMPGIYDLGSNSLRMKEYVDIEGSGENVTVITGGVSTRWVYSQGVVTGADNAEIRYLSVENTGTSSNSGNYFFGIANIGTATRISHVTVSSVGTGYYRAAIGSYNGAAVISDVKAVAGGDTTATSTIYDYDSNTTLRNVDIQASGTNICVGVEGAGPYAQTLNISNATITASVGNRVYGVYNSGADLIMEDVSIFASQGVTGNHALYFLMGDRSATLSNVNAAVEDGPGNDYGLRGNWFDVTIEGSTIDGEIENTGYPLRIGASRLSGPVTGGPNTCVASYDFNFTPLDALCQ